MAYWWEEEDNRDYAVVTNHEEQYSIWLAHKKPPPKGWFECGKVGKKADCLAWVKEVWTDMRPLSLQVWMAEQKRIEEAEKGRSAST